jgi:hypothetical protein
MAKTPEVKFARSANAADVSPYSIRVLVDILTAAGLPSCVISSTARSPRKQAEVMYANLDARGAKVERGLYREPGQAVIAVYEDYVATYATEEETIAAMTEKIVELGPSNVSHHCSDHKRVNVFDVAPSSVQAKLISFEKAVRADKRVAKFITPPQDAGFHLEIPQPEARA